VAGFGSRGGESFLAPCEQRDSRTAFRETDCDATA
jgi:hypothetical protein